MLNEVSHEFSTVTLGTERKRVCVVYTICAIETIRKKFRNHLESSINSTKSSTPDSKSNRRILLPALTAYTLPPKQEIFR